MEYRSPVYAVRAVPIEKIVPNTYNPNAVAPPEMKLLYDSIKSDGYTMPIVCYYSSKEDIYVIVDGFHRYRVMLEHDDIYQRERGLLPVSVIDKPMDQRMASTIRHNRARGSRRRTHEQYCQRTARTGQKRRMDFKTSGHGQGRNSAAKADHRTRSAFQGHRL